MPILSARLIKMVQRELRDRHGLNASFLTPHGETVGTADALLSLRTVGRKCRYALQESVNRGKAHGLTLAPGLDVWVLALEDRRMVHGGLMGGPYRIDGGPTNRTDTAELLLDLGLPATEARRIARRVPVIQEEEAYPIAAAAFQLFYDISGWTPELMNENRTKVLRQEQFVQAIQEVRKTGGDSLYAFEKERSLLANIRAGDRNEARRILNEMLATIYLSSPQLVVIRARAIEMMSCLTRAAIEDNPLLEPLIENNHEWTEHLVRASTFEELSQVLMSSLDDFSDGIYLHGLNRSNMRIRQALDFIKSHHTEPVSLSSVADHIELSPSRTAHLVKEVTGQTVGQIVYDTRVRHAQHLLTQTSKNCADIAYEVGFGDQSYFTKQFRKLTGTTPARYRRAHRG